jgi:hypothetical protein
MFVVYRVFQNYRQRFATSQICDSSELSILPRSNFLRENEHSITENLQILETAVMRIDWYYYLKFMILNKLTIFSKLEGFLYKTFSLESFFFSMNNDKVLISRRVE